MAATSPGGLRAVTAMDVKPPIDCPITTQREVSIHGSVFACASTASTWSDTALAAACGRVCAQSPACSGSKSP